MKKRTRWVLGGVVVAAVVLFVLFRTVWAGEPETVITGTGVVTPGSLEASVAASGTLVAHEVRSVYVESPVKVLEILAEADESVKKGQPVLKVDLSDLEAQLEQAKINRDSQELTLRRVRDISASSGTEALRLAVQQAQGVLAADQATLTRAKADLEAAKPLHAAGALSETEYQRYQRMVEDATRRVSLSEISLSQARANLSNTQSNTRKTDDQRALDIETQQNMLRLQELNVTTLTDRLARTREALVSPIDGVVTNMQAKVGSMLSVALPAYEVSDLGTLEVKAQVKEIESRRIRMGQLVRITGDGIDEAFNVEGEISRIASTATVVRTATGEETVLEIVIVIPEPVETLRPGLTVTASIITDTRENVPVIRYAMLSETPEGEPAVFVFQNGRAVLTPIEMGITADLDIEVLSGLSGGETVILNPPQDLKDGARVTLREEEGGFFGGFRR